MKIKSKWGRGVHEGKVVAVVDGKKVFVHLRSTFETPASNETAMRRSQRVLTVLVDNVKKVADHISEPFIHAKSGDVVVLLCASEETRAAALNVLGLSDV
jgi:hypothetical protein